MRKFLIVLLIAVVFKIGFAQQESPEEMLIRCEQNIIRLRQEKEIPIHIKQEIYPILQIILRNCAVWNTFCDEENW